MTPPLTSFIGRIAQLSAVTALLREPGVRLLTLAGPAGVGKTRLAEAAAEAVADGFPDGVFSSRWQLCATATASRPSSWRPSGCKPSPGNRSNPA